VSIRPGGHSRAPLRHFHIDCAPRRSAHLLLLILQELLLLVVLDLLDLLQLLQLTLLLEGQLLLLLLLLLLGQVVGGRLPVKALGPAPHDVGAGSRGGHAGGLVVDWLPGVGGGEAVEALGDVGVRPHLRRGVMQYLVWRSHSKVFSQVKSIVFV